MSRSLISFFSFYFHLQLMFSPCCDYHPLRLLLFVQAGYAVCMLKVEGKNVEKEKSKARRSEGKNVELIENRV